MIKTTQLPPAVDHNTSLVPGLCFCVEGKHCSAINQQATGGHGCVFVWFRADNVEITWFSFSLAVNNGNWDRTSVFVIGARWNWTTNVCYSKCWSQDVCGGGLSVRPPNQSSWKRLNRQHWFSHWESASTSTLAIFQCQRTGLTIFFAVARGSDWTQNDVLSGPITITQTHLSQSWALNCLILGDFTLCTYRFGVNKKKQNRPNLCPSKSTSGFYTPHRRKYKLLSNNNKQWCTKDGTDRRQQRRTFNRSTGKILVTFQRLFHSNEEQTMKNRVFNCWSAQPAH